MESDWTSLKESLKGFLQNEVAMMREVLTNLHQEELSLLTKDIDGWRRVMEERSDIVLSLYDLRKKREDAGYQLICSLALGPSTKQLSTEDIFPAKEESNCEILSLLDQIIALIDRINLQNCRNDSLFFQVKNSNDLPLHCPYPPEIKSSVKRQKKIGVATQTKKPK